LRITFTIQAYCISLFIVYVSFPSTCQDMYHYYLFLRLVSFSIYAQMKLLHILIYSVCLFSFNMPRHVSLPSFSKIGQFFYLCPNEVLLNIL
jgi:hypothetical protein